MTNKTKEAIQLLGISLVITAITINHGIVPGATVLAFIALVYLLLDEDEEDGPGPIVPPA